MNDTDHLGGSPVGDRQWVWKSFTRGMNTLFMDRYDLPDSITNGPIPNAMAIRQAMGDTRSYAERMDLLTAVPDTGIASTGFALASDTEALIYNPSSSGFTVNLQRYSGDVEVEWFNPVTHQTTTAAAVPGGSTRTFQSPFSGEAVLYLRSAANAQPRPKPPENLTAL